MVRLSKMQTRHCLICAPYIAVAVVQDVVVPCPKTHILMELWEHSPEVAVIKIPGNNKHSIWVKGRVFADDVVVLVLWVDVKSKQKHSVELRQ